MNTLRCPNVGQSYSAYEIPLRYNGYIQLEDQWTMTVCLDEDTGFFLGATVYNGNAQRGAYYLAKITTWELTSFEPIGSEAPIPNDVMRKASCALASILGPNLAVTHTCLPLFRAKK